MQQLKSIIVTGANKGIGLGIVENLLQKPYKIYMACRNIELGNQARDELLKKYGVDSSKLEVVELDVSSSQSINQFISEFSSRNLTADILVNNAGIAFKGDTFDDQVVATTFQTNFYGTVELSEKIIPLLNQSGKIVTVGSSVGKTRLLKSPELTQLFLDENISRSQLFSLAEEFYAAVKDNTYAEKGWPKSAYGMSKLCINVYARILGRNPDILAKNIQVYVCCPGYVNTDMTSHKGVLTIEEGVVTPVWLVELPHEIKQEFQGRFFYQQNLSLL